MFFGKREKDKDVRISESQYKSFVSTFALCANIMRFVTEMGNWNSLHFELSV